MQGSCVLTDDLHTILRPSSTLERLDGLVNARLTALLKLLRIVLVPSIEAGHAVSRLFPRMTT